MSSVVLKVWIDLNANAVFAFFNKHPLGTPEIISPHAFAFY